MQSTEANFTDRLTIKKYGNRRLYSSRDSRFVTVEELYRWVKSGKTIQVVEADTDLDITSEVLTQILLEVGKAQFLPVEILEQMLRLNEKAVQTFWAQSVQNGFRMFETLQENFASLQKFGETFTQFLPQHHPSDKVPSKTRMKKNSRHSV